MFKSICERAFDQSGISPELTTKVVNYLRHHGEVSSRYLFTKTFSKIKDKETNAEYYIPDFVNLILDMILKEGN